MFAAPIYFAMSEHSSAIFIADNLKGIVTLTPEKPFLINDRITRSKSSGATFIGK